MATKSPNQRLWRNLTRIVFLLTLVYYAWMIYAWATADDYKHQRAVAKRTASGDVSTPKRTSNATHTTSNDEFGEVEPIGSVSAYQYNRQRGDDLPGRQDPLISGVPYVYSHMWEYQYAWKGEYLLE